MTEFCGVDNPAYARAHTYKDEANFVPGFGNGCFSGRKEPDVPRCALKQPEYNQNVLFRSVKELRASLSE